MKKVWHLVSLFLILAALITVIIFLNNKPKEEIGESTDTKTIELLKADKERIQKVILKSAKSEFVINRDGDKWTIEGASFKVDKDAVGSLVDSLAAVEAERLVQENASDLEQFGLLKPVVNVTINFSDGSSKEIQIGDESPSGVSNYVKIKENNNVYLVSSFSVSRFKSTMDEFRDKTLGTVNNDELVYFKLENSGRIMEFKRNDANEVDITEFHMYQYYNYAVGAKGDKLRELSQSLSNIIAEEVVTNEAKDLSQYGLDKPVLRIVAKDSSNASMDISVGKDKDESKVYFKVSDSAAVYTIDKGVFEPFINVNAFDLYDKLACIVNIVNVNKIEVKTKASLYNMEIARQTKKAESEGEQDQIVEEFSFNGKKVEEDKFKDAYQALIGLTVDSEKDKDVKENPDITVTYFLNKGEEQQLKVTFSTYNEDFYAVHVNGKSEFLISKDKVTQMLGQFSF